MIRRTTLIESSRLSNRLDCSLLLASETFQHTGSFKFRAAYHVASSVPNERILTTSSGNFGQALARACRILGKSCTVVMPAGSAQVKISAVREYGAAIELVDVRLKTREERLAELIQEFPSAYVASPYDDDLVIQGNGSLGLELAEALRGFDCIVVPVGGGGLLSGLICGLRAGGNSLQVFGAEPLLANDAARSLRSGQLVRDRRESDTIADGARTLALGVRNWNIIKSAVEEIIEVSESRIIEAVRLLFSFANLKSEPTGALATGAMLERPELFAGKRVCSVVSGGNVDPAVFADILSAHTPHA